MTCLMHIWTTSSFGKVFTCVSHRYNTRKSFFTDPKLVAVALEFDKISLDISVYKRGSDSTKKAERKGPNHEEIIRHVEGNPQATHEENMAWLAKLFTKQNFRDHDGHPYSATFDGLEKAKIDCRAEMLKIINEVRL
jgi:hypothetical protein